MDGILLIDKERGWTSRDVCNKVQHLFCLSKIGHIGTLDPFATGLLVLTIGKATKAGRFIEDFDKTYVATLTLGLKKSTGDCNGENIEAREVPVLTEEKIINVLSSFIGNNKQIPPMTSAIHHNGIKLYKLAHQGIVVERSPRDITIHSIKLISYDNNQLTFECNVSKGTYIRVLGEDIAEKLGTIGYLSSLRRISIGDIVVDNAKKIGDITVSDIISTRSALTKMHTIICDEHLVKKAKAGVELSFECEYKQILLVDNEDNPISVYERTHDNIYKCLRGLF